MIRRPPRSTLSSSSAASDVYKRQALVSVAVVKASSIAVTGALLARVTPSFRTRRPVPTLGSPGRPGPVHFRPVECRHGPAKGRDGPDCRVDEAWEVVMGPAGHRRTP